MRKQIIVGGLAILGGSLAYSAFHKPRPEEVLYHQVSLENKPQYALLTIDYNGDRKLDCWVLEDRTIQSSLSERPTIDSFVSYLQAEHPQTGFTPSLSIWFTEEGETLSQTHPWYTEGGTEIKFNKQMLVKRVKAKDIDNFQRRDGLYDAQLAERLLEENRQAINLVNLPYGRE